MLRDGCETCCLRKNQLSDMKFSCEAFALSVLTALAVEARRSQRVPHRQIAASHRATRRVERAERKTSGGAAAVGQYAENRAVPEQPRRACRANGTGESRRESNQRRRREGRDFRLTDVAGNVVKAVLT